MHSYKVYVSLQPPGLSESSESTPQARGFAVFALGVLYVHCIVYLRVQRVVGSATKAWQEVMAGKPAAQSFPTRLNLLDLYVRLGSPCGSV